MRSHYLLPFSLLGLMSATSFASADSTAATLAPTKFDALSQVSTGGVLPRPTFGVRIGAGQWNELMLDGGLDVTFKVPILPLPALRFDAEAWTKFGNYNDRHGNAISLVAIQTFLLGYAGVGPSYYFTDDYGYHRSGFGAKALAGANLPDNAFVEGGVILGASPLPIFISVGKRF